MEDATAFALLVKHLGGQPKVLTQDLIDPRETYDIVREAIEEFKPTAVVSRGYLWADPPIGQAIRLATPQDVCLANSAYTAPEGAKLGEAPGEVFMLHDTCVARMTGRFQERLIGPFDGPGSDRFKTDVTEFLKNGRIVSDVDFPKFSLPITPEHTAQAQQVLAGMNGEIIAMTGNHCMGMLPNHINVPYHCGSGPDGGWGFNIPIISPDLFEWHDLFLEREAHYMALGRAYVSWLIAKGVKFLWQKDWDGSHLAPEEQDYDFEVAAMQMAFYAVMLDICADRKISILGIPAQLIMTERLFCGDLIKGVAMSDEGPEGRNHPLHWVTEGDMDAGISHRVLREVTNGEPVFCDVRCPMPELGVGVWKDCNSGAAGMKAAGGWENCYSVRQYKGYFGAGGGTFAFRNPARAKVVGLRTGIDHNGVFGTVSIAETVRTSQKRHVVDGRWPQYNVKRYVKSNREAYRKLVTNHEHWSDSNNPISDACIIHEVVRLAAGGNPSDPNDKADRVEVLYDGREV